MLEFRLVEYINRNYNTMERSMGMRSAAACLPVFAAVGSSSRIC